MISPKARKSHSPHFPAFIRGSSSFWTNMVAVIIKSLKMKFEAKLSKQYLKMRRDSLLKEYFNLDYHRLKSLLKDCHHRHCSKPDNVSEPPPNLEVSTTSPSSGSSSCCTVCEIIFVSEVNKQISAVIACFTLRARRLLRPQIYADLRKYLWRPRHLFADNHQAKIIEARSLITYALTNATAIGKLLTKYYRVQESIHSATLRSRLQGKRVELLKSPWLIELCAYELNREFSRSYPSSLKACCSIKFSTLNGPAITCTLSESMNIDFNLTCPICLDTVFEPVALGCGHMFCNSCACASASVSTIEGLKAANQEAMCPLCRKMGVYANSVHLVQSGLLLKRRCKEFWKERLQVERALRIKEAKDHWNQQSHLFLGY